MTATALYSAQGLDLGRSPAAASSPASTARSPGATHDKALPVGKHPLPALFAGDARTARRSRSCSRNCSSAAIADAEYDAWPIRIGDGDQFSAASSPSIPIPRSRRWSTAAAPSRCGSSNPARSCVYLAEKFGEFLPAVRPGTRGDAVAGCSGRWAARRSSAAASAISSPMRPEKFEYPINRYAMEAKRQLDVLDRRLAGQRIYRRRRLFDRRYRHLAVVRAARARPHL